MIESFESFESLSLLGLMSLSTPPLDVGSISEEHFYDNISKWLG